MKNANVQASCDKWDFVAGHFLNFCGKNAQNCFSRNILKEMVCIAIENEDVFRILSRINSMISGKVVGIGMPQLIGEFRHVLNRVFGLKSEICRATAGRHDWYTPEAIETGLAAAARHILDNKRDFIEEYLDFKFPDEMDKFNYLQLVYQIARKVKGI